MDPSNKKIIPSPHELGVMEISEQEEDRGIVKVDRADIWSGECAVKKSKKFVVIFRISEIKTSVAICYIALKTVYQVGGGVRNIYR